MKSIKRWYLLGFGGVLIVCLLVATLTIIRRMQVNSQDAVSCIYVAGKGMENALKINGKDISGAYSFSVTNTCNQDVTYEIKMDVAKESNVDLSYLYTIYNGESFLLNDNEVVIDNVRIMGNSQDTNIVKLEVSDDDILTDDSKVEVSLNVNEVKENINHEPNEKHVNHIGLEQDPNGKLITNHEVAKKNEKVSIIAIPNENYINDGIFVSLDNGMTWSSSLGTNEVEYLVTNQDLIFRASYEEVKVEAAKNINIKFNFSGGHGGTESVVAKYGGSLPSLQIPERDGYVFGGYFYNGVLYYGRDGVAMRNNDLIDNATLIARWNNENYTIYFDNNGGENNVSSKNVSFGDKYGSLPIPTKSGSTFVGWYTKPEYGTLIDENSIFDIPKNVTLYANYVEGNNIKIYNVILDKMGGIGGTNQVKVLSEIPMPSIDIPSKVGYTFNGYFTERNGKGTKYYCNNGNSTHLYDFDSDITLYAYWVANAYSITLNAEDELNGQNTINVRYDETINNLPTLTKTGYNFLGWYLGDDLISNGDIYKSTYNILLEAKWEAKKYRIIFDNQGANEAGSNEVIVSYGTRPSNIVIPSKTNMTFGGYYSEKNGNGTKYYNGTGSSISNWYNVSDLTLYAYWYLNSGETVSFKTNSINTINTFSKQINIDNIIESNDSFMLINGNSILSLYRLNGMNLNASMHCRAATKSAVYIQTFLDGVSYAYNIVNVLEDNVYNINVSSYNDIPENSKVTMYALSQGGEVTCDNVLVTFSSK